MNRFNILFKTILTILAMMPFGLSGTIAVGIAASNPADVEATQVQKISEAKSYPTLYKTIDMDGLEIFYREAGPKDAPTILLLHGFPTSSHMFRNLIPQLSNRFHLVAPDYPGYGNSSMPPVDKFDYGFDNLAKIMEHFIQKVGLKKYSLYLMDYGAPVGFRLAERHPERVEALIIQNGNAYVEGIDNNFWEPIKEYWKDRGSH